jgi:hypothetical protein
MAVVKNFLFWIACVTKWPTDISSFWQPLLRNLIQIEIVVCELGIADFQNHKLSQYNKYKTKKNYSAKFSAARSRVHTHRDKRIVS